MKRLIEHGERLAAGKASRALDRAAEAARRVVPRDVAVEIGESELRLSGRRLKVRSMADPRLRSLGLLFREMLR